MATEILVPDHVAEQDGWQCTYGLCGREVEHQVLLERPDGTLEEIVDVCGLHVTPALVWGRPWPLDRTRVRAWTRPR